MNRFLLFHTNRWSPVSVLCATDMFLSIQGMAKQDGSQYPPPGWYPDDLSGIFVIYTFDAATEEPHIMYYNVCITFKLTTAPEISIRHGM